MRDRWLPVGVLAGGLFAINVVARLVRRFGFEGDDSNLDARLSLAAYSAIGLAIAIVVTFWARKHPLWRWVADVAAASGVALVLSVFVGPFISGTTPFASGAGAFFSQIWQYAAFAAGGSLLGYMIVTALGKDHRSQQLKRFADAKRSRPQRPARR